MSQNNNVRFWHLADIPHPAFFPFSANPVIGQTRKRLHMISHQYGAGGNGMSGEGRIVRTERCAGRGQCDLKLRGGIQDRLTPDQHDIGA